MSVATVVITIPSSRACVRVSRRFFVEASLILFEAFIRAVVYAFEISRTSGLVLARLYRLQGPIDCISRAILFT